MSASPSPDLVPIARQIASDAATAAASAASTVLQAVSSIVIGPQLLLAVLAALAAWGGNVRVVAVLGFTAVLHPLVLGSLLLQSEGVLNGTSNWLQVIDPDESLPFLRPALGVLARFSGVAAGLMVDLAGGVAWLYVLLSERATGFSPADPTLTFGFWGDLGVAAVWFLLPIGAGLAYDEARAKQEALRNKNRRDPAFGRKHSAAYRTATVSQGIVQSFLFIEALPTALLFTTALLGGAEGFVPLRELLASPLSFVSLMAVDLLSLPFEATHTGQIYASMWGWAFWIVFLVYPFAGAAAAWGDLRTRPSPMGLTRMSARVLLVLSLSAFLLGLQAFFAVDGPSRLFSAIVGLVS